MITINKTPPRLQEAYNFVRRFFPQWDRKGEWQIRYISGPYYIAQCNIELKTIDIRLISDDDMELYLLLIHEICHTSSPGHSKKWQDRMMRVANRINKSGYKLLSNEVINEVKRYKGSSHINSKFIYRKIVEIVMDNKSFPFNELMEYLSREYYGGGIIPYKHCRKAYDSAIIHWDRMAKICHKMEELNAFDSN
jgi:hypothetical protein